jgi:hypothetical protein
VQSGAVAVVAPEIATNPLPSSSLHRAIEQGNPRWFSTPPVRLEVFLRVAGCPPDLVGRWLDRVQDLVAVLEPAARAAPAGYLDRLRNTLAVDHERLFGVDGELDRLGDFLANPNGDWIVSVLGDPGVGKTALAYEMVVRHGDQSGFRRVAAVSAKSNQLHPAGRLENGPGPAATDWRDLLVDVARQLDLPVAARPDAIEAALPAAMPAEPCLIVLDNLETVPDARFAVRYLTTSGLLRPHKVVLTTRVAVGTEAAHTIRERRWTGPDRAAAHAYAEYLTRDDPTLEPSPADLDDVVDAAERVPLLIKLIVSQAVFRRLPIGEVIARLRRRGGPLGAAVWAFCYVDSLNALGARVGAEAVERLLSVFCAKAGGSSFAADELRTLSGIADAARFEETVAAACQLSLMRSLAGNTRFTVHSLLREFYCDLDDG